MLCPKVVSQAPHQFRSPETQATCDGCFVCQSVCSVISPDSNMYKAVESAAVFEDGNAEFQTSIKISQTKQTRAHFTHTRLDLKTHMQTCKPPVHAPYMSTHTHTNPSPPPSPSHTHACRDNLRCQTQSDTRAHKHIHRHISGTAHTCTRTYTCIHNKHAEIDR